jgi:hypothetical protein
MFQLPTTFALRQVGNQLWIEAPSREPLRREPTVLALTLLTAIAAALPLPTLARTTVGGQRSGNNGKHQ